MKCIEKFNWIMASLFGERIIGLGDGKVWHGYRWRGIDFYYKSDPYPYSGSNKWTKS